MACALTTGINSLVCKDGTPGVVEAYIVEQSKIASITVTDGVVTALTLTVPGQYWVYTQIKESASWSEDASINVQAGSVGWAQTLNLIIPKRETAKRNEILNLAQNTLSIICKDKNGKYWLLGMVAGCDMDSGTKYESGTKLGDVNGWTLVFKAAEHDPAPEVDSSIIAALLVSND